MTILNRVKHQVITMPMPTLAIVAIGAVITILVLVLFGIAVLGAIAAALWNSVIPDIFGLPTISTVQALLLWFVITVFFSGTK